MKHTVTLIAGEGIGLEIAAAVQRIIDASGVERVVLADASLARISRMT